MRSCISNESQLERLEQRRLLCGDFTHAALQSTPSRADGVDAVEAPARLDSGNVISAFARGGAETRGVRVVWGEQTIIDGSRLATWALVSPQGDQILAVGLTLPLRLIENQPQQSGSGPAGAIASLEFPLIVQETTYFNHLELHTQPNGHPISPLAADPNRFRVPHFDFHFYRISEEQVQAIAPTPPPLPPVPPQLLPDGYAQAGPVEPQMGRHAPPFIDLTQVGPFNATMIAGFTPSASQMHFIEPMITRQLLLQREDFSLPVPMPQSIGQETLYPTSFQAVSQGTAYQFVFAGFNDTDVASTAGSAEPALTFAAKSDAFSDRLVAPATKPLGLFADQAGCDDNTQNGVEELLN